MKNPGWANNRGSPPYVSRNSSYQIPRSANAPAAMILKANTACGDEDGSFSILGLCSDFYASKRVPTPGRIIQTCDLSRVPHEERGRTHFRGSCFSFALRITQVTVIQGRREVWARDAIGDRFVSQDLRASRRHPAHPVSFSDWW